MQTISSQFNIILENKINHDLGYNLGEGNFIKKIQLLKDIDSNSYTIKIIGHNIKNEERFILISSTGNITGYTGANLGYVEAQMRNYVLTGVNQVNCDNYHTLAYYKLPLAIQRLEQELNGIANDLHIRNNLEKSLQAKNDIVKLKDILVKKWDLYVNNLWDNYVDQKGQTILEDIIDPQKTVPVATPYYYDERKSYWDSQSFLPLKQQPRPN